MSLRDSAWFLDTSALLKLVWDERGSDCVRKLCEEAPDGHVLTSYLALAEAVNRVKARWVREKEAKDDTEREAAFDWYARALETLFFPLKYPFQALPFSFSDRGALWSALREIREERTGLDAVDLLHGYLLMAGDVERSVGAARTVFVCADRDLLKYCRTAGIDVLNPEEEEQG